MNALNTATGKQFLPNLISGQQVEIPANRITTISNLGYITQDQKFNIAILNDRVDINYNRLDETDISLSDFYSFAVLAMQSIMDTFHLKSYRLAANIHVLATTIESTQIPKLGKQLIKTATYYDKKPFVEWSTRINSESYIKVDEQDETLNTILSVDTVFSPQDQQPSVLYHIDINTLPQKTALRFLSSSLKDFVDATMPIVERILCDVERLITVD